MKKEFFDSLFTSSSTLFFIFAVVAFLHCFHIENRAGETYNEKVETRRRRAMRCVITKKNTIFLPWCFSPSKKSETAILCFLFQTRRVSGFSF
jgi:hypothetical protein